MNDKAYQELVIQTMQDNSKKLDAVSKDVVEVRTISRGVSDRLEAVETNSHTSPCADVQILREKVTTGVRIIRWFVGPIVVIITSVVIYWLTKS
jgi:hypothetical protein